MRRILILVEFSIVSYVILLILWIRSWRIRIMKRLDWMTRYTWTYDDYLEWDKEYREAEHLLEKYASKHTKIKEYIEKKYMIDE
jgi:hypothetical protein